MKAIRLDHRAQDVLDNPHAIDPDGIRRATWLRVKDEMEKADVVIDATENIVKAPDLAPGHVRRATFDDINKSTLVQG